MTRFFTVVLTLLIVFSNTALAQEPATNPELPPVPALPRVEATGPLNCFDYYTFGSVQADLNPTVASTVPGALMTFAGEVVSANPYPLLDGTLYVKIFKRSEDTFAQGDGNEVIDQFVVKDGIILPSNGKLPVSYQWRVPANLPGGEYYTAYFFTTAKRYNLMGLSFTDDVVGNQASFKIINDTDPKTATLSKINTKLNKQDHHFAAFPLHFAAGDTVTVETTITNPGDTTKTMPLQWNQYAWDAMNKDNLQYTKTEVVTLKPKETKTVTYAVQPQSEAVVYTTAVTQDNEVKSILNVRYVRDGIEETRINFPGLTQFPLNKDTEATLFACAHSTNQSMIPGNTLTLTLKDRAGELIHEYKYEGDISSAMSGFGDTFKSAKNINYATLTATLERNGAIVEQVTQTYDCTVIDPSICLPEEPSVTSAFDYIKTHLMTILLSGVIVLLLAAIATFWFKKRRNHIDVSGPAITKPTAFIFFLLILPSLFFTTTQVTEAKSVVWNSTENVSFFNDGTQSGAYIIPHFYNPTIDVTYSATITNTDTGTPVTDGSSVPVGTHLLLQTMPHTPNDISWFGEGYYESGGVPVAGTNNMRGYWISNASSRYYAPTLPLGSGVACPSSNLLMSESVAPYSDHYTYLSVSPQTAKTVSLGSNLSCDPPAVDAAGTLTTNCIVTGAGATSLTFNIPATIGNFYHERNVYLTAASGFGQGPGSALMGCGLRGEFVQGNISEYVYTNYLEVNQSMIHPYTLDIPAQNITFNLNAVAGNLSPANFTITGPTTGVINTVYTFDLTATDAENNTLRYGIDWDNNGSVDEWVPGAGYVNSGTMQSVNHSWGSVGSYTFQALAQDSNGASSGWVAHTIAISAAPAATADLKVNGQDGPIDVAANTVVNLNWTSANAASCSKWGGTWGSGETIPLTGLDTTIVTATTSYMINCGGIIDTVQVNVVTPPPPVTGTCNNSTQNACSTGTFSDRTDTATTYEWSCNGSGGGTNDTSCQMPIPNTGLPNLISMISCTPSTTFNPLNGDYDFVTVRFQAHNSGDSASTANANFRVQLDSRTPDTGTVGPLAKNADSSLSTYTYNTVPFGAHTVTATIDTGTTITESNEADNTATTNCGGLPPPDPGLNLTATRYQVRHLETSVLNWTIASPYAGLTCQVTGPKLNLNNVAIPSGSNPTAPINAKSEFILKCTHTSGASWTDSVNVETTGTIEEI